MRESMVKGILAARLASMALVNLVGAYAGVLALVSTFFSMFSSVDGLVKGVLNVKLAVPTVSLPGYLLVVAAAAALPPCFVAMCLVSQLMAHPAFTIAVLFICAWRSLDIFKGQSMVRTVSGKKLEDVVALFRSIERKQIFC